jgi:hypothetical protein
MFSGTNEVDVKLAPDDMAGLNSLVFQSSTEYYNAWGRSDIPVSHIAVRAVFLIQHFRKLVGYIIFRLNI